MALTHVCRWDHKNGYVPVSIEEASRQYPYTVQASSGIFVCSLCGQNVTLTAPGKYVRYFKHQQKKDGDECEDRAEQYGQQVRSLDNHDMPIRIQVTENSFHFEMGFFFPRNQGDEKLYCERIRIRSRDGETYEYNFDRLRGEGITYLNIGKNLSDEYTISYTNPSSTLRKYWPSTVKRISSKGYLFESKTGRMISPGGNAYLGEEYYLVQKGRLMSLGSAKYVSLEEILTSRGRNGFGISSRLYKVKANEFSELSARFFLERFVFLTQRPSAFYPVWPIHVKDPYFIYHEQDGLYFFMSDVNAELNAYPGVIGKTHKVLANDAGQLCKFMTSGREQLVSMGAFGGMAFSYVVKKPLQMTGVIPKIDVKDWDGNILEQDLFRSLPKNKALLITSPYDGRIRRIRNEIDYEVKWLKANEELQIGELGYGDQVLIYVGCDLARTLSFERTTVDEDDHLSDDMIYKTLKHCKGKNIKVDHTIGTLAHNLSECPKTKAWLLNAIKRGTMSLAAYQYLKKLKEERNRMMQ